MAYQPKEPEEDEIRLNSVCPYCSCEIYTMTPIMYTYQCGTVGYLRTGKYYKSPKCGRNRK